MLQCANTEQAFVLCVGAQIIDMMLLVVDATKGMQTQTAEVGSLPYLAIIINPT